MDLKEKKLHYHIHWSGHAMLDWERFRTRPEAEAGASQLVRQGEAYTIEEYGDECQRCRDAAKPRQPPLD